MSALKNLIVGGAAAAALAGGIAIAAPASADPVCGSQEHYNPRTGRCQLGSAYIPQAPGCDIYASNVPPECLWGTGQGWE
jgi:hypothetical protein